MSEERKCISIIDSVLPRGPECFAGCFDSDSEIITINGERTLFSIDSFSSEDMFRLNAPTRLGWNVAVAAMSDILACGGTPLFYGYAVEMDRSWDEAFLRRFSEGVARALKPAGVSFIGGDLGQSHEWHYTAAVIGRLEGEPVLRKGAAPGHIIYLSGKVGTGNLEAAMNLYAKNLPYAGRFSLRLSEASVMRRYATCCIDTSDGVFAALNAISEINGTGYCVEHLPYIHRGVLMAKTFSLPESLLFFGGSGEYELLFTIEEEKEKEFLRAAKSEGLKFYRLGRMTGGKPPGRYLEERDEKIDISDIDLDARDHSSREEYIKKLIRTARELGCRDA